jgi:hypothetical protein
MCTVDCECWATWPPGKFGGGVGFKKKILLGLVGFRSTAITSILNLGPMCYSVDDWCTLCVFSVHNCKILNERTLRFYVHVGYVPLFL